jgi:hypothetical protein
MLSLDKTEDGMTVCGRFAWRIPRRSWLLSFLKRQGDTISTGRIGIFRYILNELTYQINRTESPATSLFALTKMLQPVVRRCLFG